MAEAKARILADVRWSIREKLDELSQTTGISRKDLLEEMIEKKYMEIMDEKVKK